jgi:hypothetical protein
MAPAPTSSAAAETPRLADETGLEKASAKTPAIITTPEEYRGALLRWQEQHFNVLTPFTHISGMAPQHGIITSLIQVNAEKTVGEVYDGLPFLKGGEVALAKVGLRKLAECAGISYRTERTDGRRIPNYWEFKAIASYRGIDGSTITREATKEWDLRDGSPQMRGWTGNQIEEGRKHGLRNCEARAINAAIRECGCGIKQKYTRDELKKPFVVCRVIFQPDMSDPDIKRLVTQHALSGTSTLYPPAARERAEAGEISDQEPERPRQIGSGSTTPANTSQATTSSTPPAQDLPPNEGAVKIAKVEMKDGETKGRKWTRYTIVDSNGVAVSTFDKGHYDDAARFKAENAWVEIVAERDGDFVNVLEIIKAGSSPKLPGLDGL